MCIRDRSNTFEQSLEKKDNISNKGNAQFKAHSFDYNKTQKKILDPHHLSKSKVIAADLKDKRAEVYRQLRSQILPIMHNNKFRTLAITSPHDSAGKTLTAINLAISISQEVNQTVMLVDLNFRKPSVHTTLGFNVDKGLYEHLISDVSLESILINPSLQRLVIIPNIPQENYSSELLTSPKMKDFMLEIVSRYKDRLIIFDLPSILDDDDAIIFTPTVDACLFVTEDHVTKSSEIKKCIQLLSDTNVIGSVLNKKV